MLPKVSIILTTYNRCHLIEKAVQSVLDQTFTDFEFLIINDGSTDNTAEILEEYKSKDARIKVIHQENIGFPKSLNKGIKLANGKYIARLDDDDFWSDRNKLEKQVNFLETHPDYILVGGGMTVINEKGKELFRYLPPKKDKEIRKLILFDNPFTHSTVVFRKTTWELAGGYDEKLCFSEDWDLWLRFGKLGKFYNLQEYFIYYLKGKQNISNFNRRQNLKINLVLRKRYRYDYLGFWKAFLFGWASYLQSFLPFTEKHRPIFPRLKGIIFGSLIKVNKKF